MNCCFCGPVKNCGPYLLKVFDNIEKMASLFEDYSIIIYYDSSDDNTLEILREYQIKNPKLLFYVNSKALSRYRTHNIAMGRNFCLKYIRQNIQKFPFFIMMDFDDVNCKEVNIEPLRRSLLRNDWDGLSFNTSPYYYDIWALSIHPYYFSYNHFNDSYNYSIKIKDYIMNILRTLKPGQLLPCTSSFNGFSIYRTNKFLNTYYDGRIRNDLFTKKQIETHARAQKSKKMIYVNYGNVNGFHEDCEHRAFHKMAIQNSGARILISPEIIFK